MNKQYKILLLLVLFIFTGGNLKSQDVSRWHLTDDGGIEWQLKKNDSHMDHIEMSGLNISVIVHYGVQQAGLKQRVQLIFPMLRTIPNDTHASLMHETDNNELTPVKINGKAVIEKPTSFFIKGILSYRSETDEGIQFIHLLYPSVDKAIFIDKLRIINPTDRPVIVKLPKIDLSYVTEADKGVYGSYTIKTVSDKYGTYKLNSQEFLEYNLIYSGCKTGTEEIYISPDYELKKREKVIDEIFSDLIFESPDKIINTSFSFAKLRATESIYETKGGLMHGPGGGRYYAAIWANDQAEYANPFFPFLGNPEGNESAINSFRLFAEYVNPDYKPIPSSIIAEGTDFWNGAGDRGDMAMIAYGASRFALAYGDKNTARDLWPLIEWCLEYSRRKLNNNGVVSSDSDELEGRFPAGNANLNTSSLYYDALISAVMLGRELNIESSVLEKYSKQAQELEKSIEKFFGHNVSGYETYRYYEGNNTLRAWICTPLTVNIFTRSQGTIDALFSDKLWTSDGLASEAGNTTFWDRATLYALRGVFAAGETERAMDFFNYYSKRRLLGEHVPYPVEAYPEGNQRQLSAESALYCRVVTEGIFGIRPTGLSSFSIRPELAKEWDSMALRNIKSFNQNFDIEVKREKENLLIKVFNNNKLFLETLAKAGELIEVQLK